MRRICFCSLLLGLAVGNANADPANLEGGVLIAHYVEEMCYTPFPDPCGAYMADYAIDNCNDQVNRIYTPEYALARWFVLAAWYEDKIWCGTEFGFGDYDARIFAFAEYNCCFPGQGLETPTGGWPGPMEGIALIITDIPWQGNFVAVMHLYGYAYSYYGGGQIPLDVYPPTGFAGTTNCLSPPEQFDAVCLGAMGINMAGIYCCPQDPTPARVLTWEGIKRLYR